MKEVRISMKRIERAATLGELEAIHEYGWKLRRSIEKSRESLDPFFCHSCLRSCHLEDGLMNRISDCCHVRALDKNQALERVDDLLTVAGEKLRSIKGPLEEDGPRRIRKRRGVRTITTDGDWKVTLDGKLYAFSEKKRLRKFLREKGFSITTFTQSEDGVYHE